MKENALRQLGGRLRGNGKNIPLWAAVVGGLTLGAAVYILFFGVGRIPVGFDAWLRQGNDLGQGYTGWLAFRNAPWGFPWGLTDGLSYPDKMCIMYIDAIPLCELIFKVLSPILPATAQYWGIYGLACYALQGAVCVLLLRRIIPGRNWCHFVLSAMMTAAPCAITRLYGHKALGTQVFITLAFLLWVYKDRFGKLWQRYLTWCLLFFILPLVHAYYVGIDFIILCAFALENLLKREKLLPQIGLVGLSAGSTLLSMAMCGAFYGNISMAVSDEFGAYQANLIDLFCLPIGHVQSVFIPQQEALKSEDVVYLGFGLIVLVVAALVLALVRGVIRLRTHAAPEGEPFTQRHARGIALVVLVFVAVAFANLPIYRVRWRILFTVPLSPRITELLSVFRCNARFMWIVWYLVVMVAACVLLRKKALWTSLLLCACFVLQCVDLYPMWFGYRSDTVFWNAVIKDTTGHQTGLLKDSRWETVGRDYEYMVIADLDTMTEEAGLDMLISIADVALEHDMKLNNFYYSRKRDPEIIDRYTQESIKTASPDTIFIGLPEDTPGYYFYTIDGIEVATSQENTALEG